MDLAVRKVIASRLRAGDSTGVITKALNVSRKRVKTVRDMLTTRGNVDRNQGQGRKREKRTTEVIQKVKRVIKSNPRRSMTVLAQRYNMGATTMRKLIKGDLGMRSRAITTKNKISQQQKTSRLERCKHLLKWMKTKTNSKKVRVFSDEKLFTVDPVLNRRNDRYLSDKKAADVDPSIKYSQKGKHSSKIMVLGVVGSDGQKCPPIFTSANEKINQDKYLEMLRQHVLPWLRRAYPGDMYVFQQDGAPAHTAEKTQDFLKSTMADVWTKDLWPPSSPDLNPLDFSIWARLEAEACKVAHPNLESLKSAIRRSWHNMDSDYIQRACGAFRPRVERVIAAEGDFIE